ncbi:MAG: UDP-N-acetylmuramoyl-tripeptide--D-alanyl-D-alanine ligase, partial [Acidobacteriales bacterium]|nr:UDP-N-acetylmuramoyl-tripeptide--D-alanyl-D-alanine ligase [Terriglobales bacterium]
WAKRVIGLTGSAGKTTTKDATAAVLSSRFSTLKSAGNLNNHIGVPLQLLRLEPEHEMAVIEMGMNHSGEITELCRIAEPDWAIVTNVGTAHAGNFVDGIEGVRKAKYELIEHTRPDGVVVLNGDDQRVRHFGRDYKGRAIYFGVGAGMDVWAESIRDLGALGTEFDLGCSRSLTDDSAPVQTKLPLIGRHNLMNALAASATGIAAGIPLKEIARTLEALRPGEKRGEVLHIPVSGGTATLVNDTYNSNPKALNAMVEALMKVPAKRRIVVAGEMLELGEEAPELHRECGLFIARHKIEMTVGVRGNAEWLVRGVREGGGAGTFVDTPQQAGELLSQELREGDAVLLKASRGVRLEGALDCLKP